jgi:selenide,water dikinase
MAGEEAVARITRSMSTLNLKASELMQETGVDACTDVTGFGLLGHAAEMIEGTDVGMVIDSAAVPFFPEARELAEMGLIPAGLYRNREFRNNMVEIAEGVPQYLADILFDPQTSGGLLIAMPEEKAAELLERLHAEGVTEAAIIGEVVAQPRGSIIVR